MKRIYLFILLLKFALLLRAKDDCPRHSDFKCFWDGACIPHSQKCDGNHDCADGEDETEWFAGCKNCTEDEFRCHKSELGIECIDKESVCDGYDDCPNGEDETYEFAKCKKSCKRDLAVAAQEGRTNCRKTCKKDKDCRPKKCKKGDSCDVKKCVCDHGCGMSCVNIAKTCPPLEMFPNLKTIRYIRTSTGKKSANKYEEANPPFTYDVRAYHICEPGYEALPNDIRYCVGRGNAAWTRNITCAKSCPARNGRMIKEYKITCGMNCQVDGDCPSGENCTCDGPCGRTCVNNEVECGDAPSVPNAFVEYTGEKFDRVAHYICDEGYYTDSGDSSRKCTGSGKYDGIPIQCRPVTCADPLRSIQRTGGRITNYQYPTYEGTQPFNTTFEFACGSGQRLLGSQKRTCMSDGKWSGLLTVCDNIGNIERCPHPGAPVGGELVGSTSDSDFMIGKWVKFSCDEGRVMIGQAEQKCLYIKQWSGDGAPVCADPRYSDSPTEVINKLRNNVANIRQRRVSKAGRTIVMDSRGNIEVYFVIDLSSSIKLLPLRNTIDFAKGLVKRLSSNYTGDRVSYGIVVFAIYARVKLNILEEPKKKSQEVIDILEDVYIDVEKIRKKVNYGTNIQSALRLLDERMLSFSYINDPQFLIKRHIMVLTDGRANAGGDPSEARQDIEGAYADNPPEFYSITSSARTKDPIALEQLKQIASNNDNYVYVDDFYKLHSYIDKVTDVREDYSPCGQAGEVGSVRKMVSLGRTIGGEEAAERAWPWQVLVLRFDERLLRAFHNVAGGGSLINNKWILSAAHVFNDFVGGENWELAFVFALGIIKRPRTAAQLQGSVKIFQPEKIYIHDQYEKFNGTRLEGTYQNDVALIKLGGEYSISPSGLILIPPTSFSGSVEFTPYIRPVCLPCSPDSCVSKLLMKPDGKGERLLKGDEDNKTRCDIEHQFLMGKNKDGRVAVVATGFGHNATKRPEDDYVTPTHALKQAVLNIQERDSCTKAAQRITTQIGFFGFKYIFSKQMFCAVGSEGRNIVDTCKGDSGGPLVREVRDEATKESCFVQLGIVSWGYGCGQYMRHPNGSRLYYPGFYADVASAMPWITKTMEKHEQNET